MKRALVALGVLLASLAAPLPGLVVGAASAQEAASTQEAEAARPGVVNLNTATEEELMRLPGVGPSRAAAIVAMRQRRPFRRAQEILRVRGIGRATFRRLEPHLAVDGPTTLR